MRSLCHVVCPDVRVPIQSNVGAAVQCAVCILYLHSLNFLQLLQCCSIGAGMRQQYQSWTHSASAVVPSIAVTQYSHALEPPPSPPMGTSSDDTELYRDGGVGWCGDGVTLCSASGQCPLVQGSGCHQDHG